MGLMQLIAQLAALAGLGPPPAYQPPDPAEVALVRQRLAPLQMLSFVTDLEYCGYLGRDDRDRPVFTRIQRGDHDSCTPLAEDQPDRLVASLHTHGSYDPEVPAEFPTVLDMDSDHDEGVNGYVSTPGGRLWYIDSRAMIAVQLCGLACLPQDPRFHPGDDGVIADRYTRAQLQALEDGDFGPAD